MRIAIITGEYPPMEGGVGDFTYHLSRTLSAQGHDLCILTSTVEENIPGPIANRISHRLSDR